MEGDLKPLTERERRFVEAYMGEAAGNGTTAAIAAGYSRKGARQQASHLLTKANIRAAIDARASTDPAVLTREERQQWWSEVTRDATHPIVARLKASELLGKSQADFIERHEHAGKDGGPIVVKFGGRYKEAGA